MNTTDQIESLLKQGVITLTIGTSPNKLLFIQAQQGVHTGPNGTHCQVTHQAESESLVECLNLLAKQVEHLNQIKVENLVVVKGGRG